MTPKFIDQNQFLDYWGVDLRAKLKNDDNPSAKIDTFLARVEKRLMAWINKNTFRIIDFNHLTNYQLEHFRYALLEQANYMYRNGDIAQDSGYDQERGIVAEHHAMQELVVCQPCIDFLIEGGLFNLKVKNRRRFMNNDTLGYEGAYKGSKPYELD